jgi:aminopeptidase N
VWREQKHVAGLTLGEPDYVTLSEELAIRAGTNWRLIIDQQVARTMNPDRRERLQFVMPALSNDPSERDRFFASLEDVANRRHEPWVLEAVRYLHHPLRADRSLRYIGPSLEWLETIQRTGDIFFPKRWMEVTLGGDRSPAAAQVVRAFVDRLPPGYPDRLRRIILSSADDLFRASR